MLLLLRGSFSNGFDPAGLYVALVLRPCAGCEVGWGWWRNQWFNCQVILHQIIELVQS
jgi:hypothetical protein